MWGVWIPIWRVIWMFYRMNGINNKPAAYFLALHRYTNTPTSTQCESVWWFPAAPPCRMRNICLILTRRTHTHATPFAPRPRPHTQRPHVPNDPQFPTPPLSFLALFLKGSGRIRTCFGSISLMCCERQSLNCHKSCRPSQGK